MDRTVVSRCFTMLLVLAVCFHFSGLLAFANDVSEATPAVVTGELTILYGDDFANRRSELFYVLEEAVSKRRFNLRFKGKPPAHLRSGAVVTARGRAKGRDLFLEVDESGGQGVETVAPASAAIAGEQKTIVIVADFLDASVSCSVGDIQDLMFSDPGDYSVDDLYQETSAGEVWLTGDVVGPYTINYTSTGACDYSAWATAAEAAARADGVDMRAYNRKVYVLPRANPCGWAGLGTVGGNPSRAWILRCSVEDVFAHELGHNLGMHHASTPSSEYGDRSDIMGIGGLPLRQINAPHREQAGWVNPEQVLTATQSGAYHIAPLELDPWEALGPQVVKLAKPDTNDYYYLSYRQPVGFDTNLSAMYLTGVSVHRYKGDGSANRTYLLDSLVDGESFVDAANGVTITQESHNAGYVTVRLDLGTGCDLAPPTVSLSPASQSGLAGTASTYSVTVTNADSSACGDSTFSLGSSVPAGWTGTLSPASLTLSPGATGSATLTVSSPSGAAEGTYGLNVNVSDPAEPAHTASDSANYVVLPTCSPAAPTVTLSPASRSGLPGATVTYAVSVTNEDSSACGDSTFSLGHSVPAGWTGTLSPAFLTLSPGATDSATLSVSSPSGTAEGTYGLKVNVSDPAEPGHTASDGASYVVLPTCSPAPPTLTLSPASRSGVPGTTVTYSVSVTNEDSSACGSSTFSLRPSLPAGWTGTLSPTALTLSPGASGFASLSVTSSAGAPEATHGLGVEVSDAAEPVHTASDSASYVVLGDTEPPTAPTGLTAMVKRKQVNLYWAAAADNVGVSGYSVWRDGDRIGDTTGTRYVTAARDGTTCTYHVVAHDAAGNVSEPSNTVTVTVQSRGNGGKGKKK